ncbi:MAG: VWA domain-containing protein, partial [Opitutales bacterium]
PSETSLRMPASRPQLQYHPQAGAITDNLSISGFVDSSYRDANFQPARAAYLHHRQLAQLSDQDQREFEREGVPRDFAPGEEPSTEEYDRIYENPFLEAEGNPLSTFSIDVDTASYANSRRYLRNGRLPPKDAVRIEEFINYFNYDYPAPTGADPFSINCELGPCPWNDKHELLLIGLQGKKIDVAQLPPSNLVFLADVSGSMSSHDKLPLLKASLRMLVDNLRPEDRVALVVYAGAAGLVLDSTSGKEKKKILAAIDNLNAGGSTAGGAGIRLAYKVAKENFMPKGNNRIILATDGDFNVGVSSDAEMTRLIESKRDDGVFLTVLGYGTGNYKDSKMEKLADKGNGNYAYIDSIREAKKALVTEMGGTLFTIAKDVKLQLEFNPATVSSYRLIGYENRMLKKEDFNDDKKDAGELGAGHRVTALYEIVRVGVEEPVAKVDKLKYQKKVKLTKSEDLLTLKLRYKAPKETKSQLITRIVKAKDITPKKASDNWAFSSAVAEFAMVIRDSKHKGTASFDSALERARKARGKDEHGYRAEFVHLIEEADLLARR